VYLSDELIDGAMDSIAGYMVAQLAAIEGRPVADVMDEFMASRTYALLRDKQTGLYWDSIPATMDLYRAERAEPSHGPG
jgi:hypothetical protein